MMKAKGMLPLLALPLLTLAVSMSEPVGPAKAAKSELSGVSASTEGPSKSALAKPGPKIEPGKLILVLRTRHHRISVYGGGRSPKYTVHTEKGVLLSKKIDGAALKAKYPALHPIVTGVAWAGNYGPLVFRGD